MEQIVDMLVAALKASSPVMVALMVPSGALTKVLVDLARKTAFPNMKGNAVQSLTAVIALVSVLLQAAPAGIYTGGVTAMEAQGLAMLTIITWLTAMGVHNAVQNKNPVPDGKAERELDSLNEMIAKDTQEG